MNLRRMGIIAEVGTNKSLLLRRKTEVSGVDGQKAIGMSLVGPLNDNHQ